MDPNETLKVLLKEASFFRDLLENDDPTITDEDYDRLNILLEHIEALDEWLSKGGFLPAKWGRRTGLH